MPACQACGSDAVEDADGELMCMVRYLGWYLQLTGVACLAKVPSRCMRRQ